jgi:arsenate reductase-like glutaredoxin family protein
MKNFMYEKSRTADELKKMIEKTFETNTITRDYYDKIMHYALKDSHLDREEVALLAQFHKMIEQKIICFIK